MFRSFLAAYPWDLIDEDLGLVLDRFQGEYGTTGVSVWMATPSLIELRVHDVEPRVFRTRGGLFFHPCRDFYAATRCKPIVSTWAKSKDPLDRIARACDDRKLALRAKISASLASRLAQRQNELACRNVFGDRSQQSVCLANPDVQTYLGALIADLSSRQNLAGITVTDYQISWAEADHRDLLFGRALGETERSLLATCFCESCLQRAGAAGVDVAMARRRVRVALQKSLSRASVEDTPDQADRSDHEPLAAYIRWRDDELSSLLSRLVDVCECELLLDRTLTHPSGRPLDCLKVERLSAVMTGINHSTQLDRAWCTTARRNELRLAHEFVLSTPGPEFVRLLARAVEMGMDGIEVDHYGMLSSEALIPIKQGFRLARRMVKES